MELRKMILAGNSKAQINAVVNWVGNSQQRFDELFQLFLNDEYRVVQRAASAVNYCVIHHPELIKKHSKKLILKLNGPELSDAVKRNILRLLQYVEFPKKFHGAMMNLCFGYISSAGQPVAIKAFALTILQKLTEYYPDIRDEIKVIIEERWETETPAFRSRAKKFLSSLKP